MITGTVKVLVVDDEKKIAALVSAGVESLGHEVEVCHHGDEALRLIRSHPWLAVVLDIMLPGRDGLSIVKRLRAENNPVPILLLTARGDLDERVEGLDAGADDYLAKPFSMTELAARLRAVLRRSSGAGPTVMRCGDLVVDVAKREVTREGTAIQLTPTEFSLLLCLIRTPGRVVTRVDILQTVWQNQFDPGSNLVEVTMQRLRRKIDDPFGQPLIQTIRKVGYTIQSG